MTSCKCHKLHEGYFSVQEIFCVDSNSEKSDPKKLFGRSSVNNIHPEYDNFPSGRPSVSRTFKLFKIASVQT